jgi:hypothetical protein
MASELLCFSCTLHDDGQSTKDTIVKILQNLNVTTCFLCDRSQYCKDMYFLLLQRFDYSVLTPFLPPKHEYVISIRLSDIQIKAYQYYLENCAMGKSGVNCKGAQLFSDYQNLSRIWTHPRVLQMSTETAEKNAEKKVRQMNDKELQASFESTLLGSMVCLQVFIFFTLWCQMYYMYNTQCDAHNPICHINISALMHLSSVAPI